MSEERNGFCCLCGNTYDNYGHNTQPVAFGRCCTECNNYKVIPARIKLATGTEMPKELITKMLEAEDTMKTQLLKEHDKIKNTLKESCKDLDVEWTGGL